MTYPRPSTPPSSELQYGFEQLLNHNANAQYREEPYQRANGLVLPSSPDAGYGMQSPTRQTLSHQAANQYMGDQYARSQYPELHNSGGLGLGLQYGGYGQAQSSYYPAENIGYHYSGSAMQNDSPMAPKTMTSEAARRTRSSRSMARSNSPHVLKSDANGSRVSKSPKPKKAKAGKGSAPKTVKLEGPLSILTNGMTVPVRDMEEWVNRPAEVREKEVERRNGYVTRPMNSFMLYRSAYAERTKMWCAQNNHQVVSSVSGESWPMEPPEVREQYNKYATTERANHAKAHPSYKFSPSKGGNTPRKKKGTYSSDDEADDMSDNNDPDFEWQPRGDRASAKPSRRQGKEAGYPAYSSPLSIEDSFGPNNGFNKSSWEASNESKPLPAIMGQADLFNQYYQTTVYPNMSNPGMEDVRMIRTATPGSQYGGMPSGLPGNYHPDLLQLHSTTQSPAPYEAQVDPMLLQYDEQFTQSQTDHASGDPFAPGNHFDDAMHSFDNPFGIEPVSQFEEFMDRYNAA